MGHLHVKYSWRHQLSSATYYDRRPVGTVGARRAGGAGGATRHVDAVNNGRQGIDHIYTAAAPH